MTKVTLAVFGSLGDLHPMIGVGLALQARGVRVTVATQEDYREKVLNAGLDFHPVGLTYGSYFQDTGVTPAEFVARLAADSGYVYKSVIAPYLARSIEDIRPLISQCDGVVSTSLAFHAHIAATLERKPFVVAHLSPGVMFSAYDPLKSPEAPFMSGHGPWSRSFNRLLLGLGTVKISPSLAAIKRTYKAYGVVPDLNFVVLKSDVLTLGLYSPLLGEKQPDHPANLSITGYPFYDSPDGKVSQLDVGLRGFLDSGSAPLVFSLGSAAVFGGERYYRTAVKVALSMRRRAVILCGHGSSLLGEDFGADVYVTPYAPHSLLFPRASVVVHHGGIGSAGQALLSGRPQLVTPVFADQFDNAERIRRRGSGKVLPFRAWGVGSAKAAIKSLLRTDDIAALAMTLSETVGRESGSATAADQIIRALETV
jgi:rhamnosyltransferase subunit B